MKRDDLGDRMKSYEFGIRMPLRTHTIIRIDGRAFHTYTSRLDKPYDYQFMLDMGETAKYLAKEVSGCKLAYAQSDEISLVLTDFDNPNTQAWFDNKLQKVVSVAASLATSVFVSRRPQQGMAVFDARAFTIASPQEVANYFVWRQKDAIRNSVSMLAQAHFSPGQLHGKSVPEMRQLLWDEKGISWDDVDPRFKNGQMVTRYESVGPVVYTDRAGNEQTVPDVRRMLWRIRDAVVFTEAREWLLSTIAGRVEEPSAG